MSQSRHDMDAFPRTTRTVDLGATSLRIETVESFDRLLDHYAEKDPTAVDAIPYFAQLWPSAVALAHYLAAPPHTSALPRTLRGLRAIELGCGLGLPSLTAARLGAEVLAVDFHPDNETLFRRNAEINGLDGVNYLASDWAGIPAAPAFDLVLGSDLLYERRTLDTLAAALARLCAPDGTILLADPGRDAVQSFVLTIESRGFRQWTHVVDECFVIEFTRHGPAPGSP